MIKDKTVKQEDWDKNKIITLVGHMTEMNTFIPIDSDEEYDCISYRCNTRVIKGGPLCCVNMKWSEVTKNWLIFQYVLME